MGDDDLPVPAGPDGYRLSHAERDVVAERLRAAVGEGRLTLTEAEDRLSVLYSARTAGDLVPLVADLPPTRADRQMERRRRDRARRRGFVSHLTPYLGVNGFLVLVWALSGGGAFWPAYVAGGWGVGLVCHAVAAFSAGDDEEQAADGTPGGRAVAAPSSPELER